MKGLAVFVLAAYLATIISSFDLDHDASKSRQLAGWTDAFKVNTYASGTSTAAITGLSGGGFVVTWRSAGGQDGDSEGIFAQRFDASGNAAGSEFQVNTYTTSIQWYPAIASFASGGFIITWASNIQDSSSYGIFAQRFDSSGLPVGSEFQVNTYVIGSQMNPAIATFSDGGFVIVWDRFESDIDAQRFNASGALVGAEFRVNTFSNYDQELAKVASLTDGGFVVVWMSDRQDPDSSWGIYAQRYDSTGDPTGSEFRVNTITASDQFYPDIAALPNNGFVIVWHGPDGSDYGVFGQRYDSSGSPVGSEFRANTHTAHAQRLASVAGFSHGGFIITWESFFQNSSPWSIYGQLFDASGAPVGSEFEVNPGGTNLEMEVAVTVLDDDGFVVVWTEEMTNIFARRYVGNSRAPTSAPTAGVAEHIVVHLYDLHGDGWLDDVYLKVSHATGFDLYSLHCSCKVVRIFTEHMSLSLWRNRTVPGPKGDVMPYEWEALWTVGYSDGLTETDFGIVGDINTEVEIRNYALNSSQHVVDTNHHSPTNMCMPPKPKPKASPVVTSTTDENDVANTTEPSQPGTPSSTVDVRLALQTTNGESWCDDSGATSVLACDREHHLSTDAVLPNLVLYPRYYISRTDDNRVVASGTLREDDTEWITSVKLLREGSYVFSVSGTYTALNGSVSWGFCGEEGGINERLHFNMVKGVCHADFIEEMSGGLTCDEFLSGMLLHESIQEIQPSNGLIFLRNFTPVLLLVGGAALTIILVLLLMKPKHKFIPLDTTEHKK